MINAKCNFCSYQLSKLKINFDSFSHLGFKKKNDEAFFYLRECTNCNAIINKDNFKNNLFKSKKYVSTDQSDEKIIYSKKGFLNRFNIQSNIISDLDLNYNPRIIDIGSFDGKLLNELKNHYQNKPKIELFGFDINQNLKKFYKKPIKFLKNFKEIRMQIYDLIIFSHSLMYISQIEILKKILKNNVSYNGKVFLQINDLNNRPLNILLNDQYFYPTESFIINFFHQLGYSNKKIHNRYFKNELILVFTKKKICAKNIKTPKPIKISQILNNVNNYISDVYSKIDNKLIKIYIFGTTLEASFAFYYIKNNRPKIQIIAFIDESDAKINKLFNGTIIIHPSKIDKSIYVFFPYQNLNLKNKIIDKYMLRIL